MHLLHSVGRRLGDCMNEAVGGTLVQSQQLLLLLQPCVPSVQLVMLLVLVLHVHHYNFDIMFIRSGCRDFRLLRV